MSEKLETIDPEREPEFVGAHSALTDEQCQNYLDGNSGVPDEPFSPQRCENAATHTVVMADGGGLMEQSLCDACGEPRMVEHRRREWTGEVRDS